jgi:putative protease
MKGNQGSNTIELLAPAGDLERGKTAVLCGADAVYIGAPSFGARVGATNSVKDIAELVEFAHVYHAKVYVTLNVLLYDFELQEAVQLMHELYSVGVDAFIVQDLGLLECDLPPVPLFASTQMHNATVEKVRFLEEVGFQRVILARELSLSQIAEIRRETSISLESFVHGALCVSYSGQCYLSYQIGGRSGNRGECAQPCRKKWTLKDDQENIYLKDKHLLSLKDFNASLALGDMLDAGVTSFKIEGRLKDRSYVANVVGHYRQLLDAELNKRGWKRSSCGISEMTFEPNPSKTFNRGYGEYFLKGRTEKMAQFDTPKSLGEYMGQVTSLRRNSFFIDQQHDFHNGDGVLFITPGGDVSGLRVNRVEDDVIFPAEMNGLCQGAKVYRNHDHQFEQQLAKAKLSRKIGVDIALRSRGDGSPFIFACDERGISVELEIAEAEVAGNKDAALKAWQKQLGRLGATTFYLKTLSMEASPIPFLPASKINDLRRVLVETLQKEASGAYSPMRVVLAPNGFPYPQKSVDFTGNALNSKAIAFYSRHKCRVEENAAESGLNLDGRIVMTTKYCIRKELGTCLLESNGDELPRHLFLEDDSGHHYRLKFNCSECQMQLVAED